MSFMIGIETISGIIVPLVDIGEKVVTDYNCACAKVCAPVYAPANPGATIIIVEAIRNPSATAEASISPSTIFTNVLSFIVLIETLRIRNDYQMF